MTGRYFSRISVGARLLGGFLLPWGVAVGLRGHDPLLGFGCALAGLALVAGRFGHRVDLGRRELESELGLLVAFRRTRRPFSGFRELSLDSYTVKNGRRFALTLEGEGGAVKLAVHPGYEAARADARWLQGHLGLPLVDHGVRREAAELCEPLRARLLRTNRVPGEPVQRAGHPFRDGETVHLPPAPPPGAISQVEDGPEETVILLPPRLGRSFGALAPLLGATPTLVGMAWLGHLAVTREAPGLFVLIAFLGLLAAVQLLSLADAAQRFRLTVGLGVVTIVRRSLFGLRRWRCRIEELEEVQVISTADPRYERFARGGRFGKPTSMLLVRSHSDGFELGVGLPEAELRWLVARIEHAVATRPLR